MKHKKAQIFSIDLFMALVVFIIILVFLFTLWNVYTSKLNENIVTEEMQLLSFQISDMMFKTRGIPENWEFNPTNVDSIGLKLGTGSLNPNKIKAFLGMDYDFSKELLNIERYEYSFRIFDINNGMIASSGSTVGENVDTVISLARFFTIENETKKVVFTIWEE